MRTLTKLMVGVASAATLTAMAVVPTMGSALADPPAHTTVHNFDLQGTGSDTIEFVLDQLSLNYNSSHGKDSATNPFLYSEDATNPKTGAIGDTVTLKKGCKSFARPDGSSAGILALTTENANDGKAGGRETTCIDYARSSRDRQSSDPQYKKGGVAFVTLAGDAVTYATQPKSNAPKSLTPHQLFEIYTCKVRNWKALGGRSGTIMPFIPQTGSGTRAFFLTAIGFGAMQTPSKCVSDLPTKAVPGGTLEENEGINPALNKDKANVVFPYSVGKYLAEVYHSAKCTNASCTTCKPNRHQNHFGCDTHGTMMLNEIAGTHPTRPFPLPKPTAGGCGTKCPIVNPVFDTVMTRTLYIVVPFTQGNGAKNGIAKYLLRFFGPNGFTCTNKTAKADLADYGFRVFKPGSGKGHTTFRCGDTH